MKKSIVFILCIFLVGHTAFGISLFPSASKKKKAGPDAAQNRTLLNYAETFYQQRKMRFVGYYEKYVRPFYESGYGRDSGNPIEFPYPETADQASAVGITNLIALQFCSRIPNPQEIYIKITVLGTKARQKITAGAMDATAQAVGGVGAQGAEVTGAHSVTVSCDKVLRKVCRNTCAADFCVKSESVGAACTLCLKSDATKNLKGVKNCIEDFSMKYIYRTDDAMIQQRRKKRNGILGKIGSALGGAITGPGNQQGYYGRQQPGMYPQGGYGQQQPYYGQQQPGMYPQGAYGQQPGGYAQGAYGQPVYAY